MPERTILITGACGEIGQALIEALSEDPQTTIISLDLKTLPGHLTGKTTHFQGDLLAKDFIKEIENKYAFQEIYHLAAVLSTTAEYNPSLAHKVNTGITLDLLELAARQSQQIGSSVKFLFPSSIAVYGMPDLETKSSAPPVKETQWTEPTTMYGCSKLYCEKVGSYYSDHYHQLDDQPPIRIDFRALRFPGIISAFTVPSGGTSDFGPEMIHFAAQGKPYRCFVRPDVRIPFMVMPDAVRSLLELSKAPLEKLTRRVYNVTSFSYSARDFQKFTESGFPGAQITYQPDLPRQEIVDSWPADIDDQAARSDWGWKPKYNAKDACQGYLLKNIIAHYA
ncbi:MAG TPA: NAD-dependent epimerase/dehydratase family protein [Chloroflexi bacterium]|nr:NAD-dependent epimerase/dehydratase family protein [Chloroflexota bacterium]